MVGTVRVRLVPCMGCDCGCLLWFANLIHFFSFVFFLLLFLLFRRHHTSPLCSNVHCSPTTCRLDNVRLHGQPKITQLCWPGWLGSTGQPRSLGIAECLSKGTLLVKRTHGMGIVSCCWRTPHNGCLYWLTGKLGRTVEVNNGEAKLEEACGLQSKAGRHRLNVQSKSSSKRRPQPLL